MCQLLPRLWMMGSQGGRLGVCVFCTLVIGVQNSMYIEPGQCHDQGSTGAKKEVSATEMTLLDTHRSKWEFL
jgi:hypothetical protein